ncbi:rhodanese-like domain-containing protein [Neobacillus vireti]|uniref:Rhodanese n=1 Tax=Neobacillus vireti LMG 21834 TaxID=1131730 RepID=A0AB94IUZ9_9BACI|nr:rhodanese-like domain-containing protein [Neobacillus vireti]ETI70857.1 rhodanese [Neobacillus vireti LMG 21834]KLT17610.1 beta-lactamase [Neobacillus vireti]
MTIRRITPRDLHERMKGGDKLVLLDVRAEEKYHEFHIEESRNIPKTTIFGLKDDRADSQLPLPKSEEIIVTCTTGNSAAKCAEILDNRDYQVTVLDGGLTAWKAYMSSLKN